MRDGRSQWLFFLCAPVLREQYFVFGGISSLSRLHVAAWVHGELPQKAEPLSLNLTVYPFCYARGHL